jgi:hypothetical protein
MEPSLTRFYRTSVDPSPILSVFANVGRFRGRHTRAGSSFREPTELLRFGLG